MKKTILLALCFFALLGSSVADSKAKTSSKPKIAVRINGDVFKDLKEIYGLKSRAELEKLVNKLLKEQLDVEEEG